MDDESDGGAPPRPVTSPLSQRQQDIQDGWAKASLRSTWSSLPGAESAWNRRHNATWANDGLHPNYRSYFDRWRDPKGADARAEVLEPSWRLAPSEPRKPKVRQDASMRAARESKWHSRHHLTWPNHLYYPLNRNYFDRQRDVDQNVLVRAIPEWSLDWTPLPPGESEEEQGPLGSEKMSSVGQPGSDRDGEAIFWPKPWSEPAAPGEAGGVP